MYSSFRNILGKVGSNGLDQINLEVEDTRVIFGVLYYTVIQADGRLRKEELQLYEVLLDDYLGVSEDERRLFDSEVSSRLAKRENVEQLVTALKELSSDKKHEIMQHMRDISVSDRELHEVELNLIARVEEVLQSPN